VPSSYKMHRGHVLTTGAIPPILTYHVRRSRTGIRKLRYVSESLYLLCFPVTLLGYAGAIFLSILRKHWDTLAVRVWRMPG
jgi:hypothetical protein